MRALFCGSFCPVTKGHVNIIQRAANLCDELHVIVANNESKTYEISLEDRLELLKKSVSHIGNVTVNAWSGLVAEYCKKFCIDFIVKSGRNALDLQYEMDMAQYNNQLCGAETVYLAADKEYAHISSTYVRELRHNGASVEEYVPRVCLEDINRLLPIKK